MFCCLQGRYEWENASGDWICALSLACNRGNEDMKFTFHSVGCMLLGFHSMVMGFGSVALQCRCVREEN